jgi:hypothetical protein
MSGSGEAPRGAREASDFRTAREAVYAWTTFSAVKLTAALVGLWP